MPDAVATTTASPIDLLLSIGAPSVSDSAVSGGFAALLDQQTMAMPKPAMPETASSAPVIIDLPEAEIETPAAPLPESGKPMPDTRQDLAALPVKLPEAPRAIILPSDLPVSIEAEAGDEEDGTEEAPAEAAPAPAPIILTLPLPAALPVALPKPLPGLLQATAAPVSAQPTATAPRAEQPAVRPAAEATEIAAPARPASVQSIAFSITTAAAAPITTAPVATAPAPVPAEITVAARLANQPEGQAVKIEAPARPAPQPIIIEPRAVVQATRGEAEPVSAKARARDDAQPASGVALSLPSISEVRTVAATGATAQVEPLGERVAALIETIETLRSEARGESIDISINHEDFGPVTVRFEEAEDSLVVQFDTEDAELARLIAQAAPELKQAGDQNGIRFERRDPQGTATGDTGNAPHRDARAGDRTEPSIRQPQTRATRGRSGIFA